MISRNAGIFLFFFALFNSAISSFAQVVPAVQSGKYFQEIKTEIRLPEKASSNVIKLFKIGNSVVTVTNNGVYKYTNGRWSGEPFGSHWRTATLDSNGQIWLAAADIIQRETYSIAIKLPNFAQEDTILCLFCESENKLLAGTTNGLLTFDGSWSTVPFAKGKRVNAIAKDFNGDLWLATTNGLLRQVCRKWINMDDLLMARGLKRQYFALQSNSDQKEILFSGLFTVGCIAENGENWLLRGADGLPFGPVTSIHSTKTTMWFGTGHGAISKEKEWHYYNGKRWLPNNKVNDILPIDEHTVWIATPEGISQIREVEMTLEQKAATFEERIRLRHDRHGLVSSSKLVTPGDLSTFKTIPSNNDGLWTGIYLAAECFRYAVTRDPQAKKNANKAFEAMERLETVTGIPGFPARAYISEDETIKKGAEWHPSPDKKWRWSGDTSSDEMVGHFFAYPLFYDLVAEGDLKERAKGLVRRIMNHIVDNNYQLIDLDGKPTRWGVWTPDSLNNAPGWLGQRGVNSLEILSFLKAAFHITGEQKFETARIDLIQKHNYLENIIQQKLYGPFEKNTTDDQLSFLPYYILFRYTPESKKSQLEKSMERSWNIVKADRKPMWNIIASAALKKDCDLQISVEELRHIPMDMISWTMTNSHRWDLPADPLTDRFGKLQSLKPIPAAEGGISKWNNNNYLFDVGSDGDLENDGAYFLLAYWMGRYHRYFID